MTSRELCKALEEVGHAPFAYSGRFMYGEQCVGVQVEDARAELALCIALNDEIGHEIADNVRICRDSMGLQRVVYFPDFRWPKSMKIE